MWSPLFGGKGLGRRMMENLCRDMTQMGQRDLYLLTDHTSFYEKLGWQFQEMVQENGGDFWDMMAQSLQEQLSDYGRETQSLYHFLYLPGRQSFFMLQKARRRQSDQLAEYKGWVYRNCINQEIRRLTESEFDALDDMCRALMMVSIQEYISGSQDQENIMSFFRDRLKLIRASISRQS